MPSILASTMHEIRPTSSVQQLETDVVYPKLREEERKAVESRLKIDHQVEIKGIEVDCQFRTISYTIVYLPAFVGSYVYNNQNHYFVVNAISGSHDGQRPGYGNDKNINN
jgi:hypothetical protein